MHRRRQRWCGARGYGGVKGAGTTIQFSKGYGTKRASVKNPLVQLQFAILVEISQFFSEK